MNKISSDNYRTPEWLMSLFIGWFDPCPLNPKPNIDGLKVEWRRRTYVNPPYSNPFPWIQKAILENRKGKTIVLLLKLDCSTKWFRDLIEADAHILFINERVKFNGSPPPFPNMLAILEGEKIGFNNLTNYNE